MFGLCERAADLLRLIPPCPQAVPIAWGKCEDLDEVEKIEPVQWRPIAQLDFNGDPMPPASSLNFRNSDEASNPILPAPFPAGMVGVVWPEVHVSRSDNSLGTSRPTWILHRVRWSFTVNGTAAPGLQLIFPTAWIQGLYVTPVDFRPMGRYGPGRGHSEPLSPIDPWRLGPSFAPLAPIRLRAGDLCTVQLRQDAVDGDVRDIVLVHVRVRGWMWPESIPC